MLNKVLGTFNVVLGHELSIIKYGQTLFDVIINILNIIKEVLEEVNPNVVLVHGDISTIFVLVLTCFYL